MDTEYQQLESEISRIVSQTKWNKMDLLNGGGPSGSSTEGAFILQLGADNGQTMIVTIGDVSVSSASYALLSDLDGLAVSSQASLPQLLQELIMH